MGLPGSLGWFSFPPEIIPPRGAFLFPRPWHSAPMRALTIALCLLATPALAGSEGARLFLPIKQ